MRPDNGPPDGNFAAYVESLTSAPKSVMYERPPAAEAGADPVEPERGMPVPPQTVEALRSEFGPLLRFTIIAFLLLGIASALGPPYSTAARIVALVIIVHVIRRALVRTAAIRTQLRDRATKARAQQRDRK